MEHMLDDGGEGLQDDEQKLNSILGCPDVATDDSLDPPTNQDSHSLAAVTSIDIRTPEERKRDQSAQLAAAVSKIVAKHPDRQPFLQLDSAYRPISRKFSSRRVFLRQTRVLAPRPTHAANLLDRLNDDCLALVLNALDIASLVRFASSSVTNRKFVLNLPEVRTAQAHPALSSALCQMLCAGSARHFTLHKFLAVSASTRCESCKDEKIFAPHLDLLLCRRTCTICVFEKRKITRMSQSLATQLLGLTTQEMEGEYGTAAVTLQETRVRVQEEPSHAGLSSARIMIIPGDRLKIIDLATAFELAAKKCEGSLSGPPWHARRELAKNQLVYVFHEGLRRRWPSTFLTYTCSHNDATHELKHKLEKAAADDWSAQYPSQQWILMENLPRLVEMTVTSTFDWGFVCEGCTPTPDAARLGNGDSLATRSTLSKHTYSSEQRYEHLIGCRKAHALLRGQRLMMSERRALKDKMMGPIDRARSLVCTDDATSMLQEASMIMGAVDLCGEPSVVRRRVSVAVDRIGTTLRSAILWPEMSPTMCARMVGA